METITKHLILTILYDEIVGRIKECFLNNDKQTVIFYYMFNNNSRLHRFITYAFL